MAFKKKTWTDRMVEYAGRRKLTNISTKQAIVYDVERAEGTVSKEGDAFSSQNMNDFEQRVEDGFAGVQQDINEINSDLGDFIRPADYSAKIYESQCPPGQTVTYTAITNCWVAYNTYGNSSGSNVMINDVQVDAAYTTDNFRANANGLLYLKREDIFSLHSEISSGGYRIYATI